MYSLLIIKSGEILGTVGLLGAVYYKKGRLFAKDFEYWFQYVWSINPKFLRGEF